MKPLDRILEALRATGPRSYRADTHRLDVWWAQCPSCGFTDERRLRIEECARRVELTCATGCRPTSILAALREAERTYPAGWPSGGDPATVGRVADVLLELVSRRRRQQAAEREAAA